MREQQQKHILVIDDDPEIPSLLGPRLVRSSLTTDFATSAREAVDLIQHTNYSVVLLNVGMPGGDGVHVLERLSAESAMPVVLVMTSSDQAAMENLDANRIHGVVHKPIDPDDLVALMRECAEIKSRGVFGTMAIASVLACGPIFALLNHFTQ